MGRLRARLDPDGDGDSEVTVSGAGWLGMVLAFVLAVLAIDAVFGGGRILAAIAELIAG